MTLEMAHSEDDFGMKALLLATILGLCVSEVESKDSNAEGSWGPWIKISKCHECQGIRYKYNCTSIDSRETKKPWNPNGVCERGIYYERFNKGLNRCFMMEAESSVIEDDDSKYGNFSSSDTGEIIQYMKDHNLWDAGRDLWTRCSRRAGRRKNSIYNRRGRQARAYYCPTDNYTIWREEWRYCCAGEWTDWTVIETCPKCSSAAQKLVRICTTPNAILDVEKLSLDGEFMSDWQEKDCNKTDCPKIDIEMKECSILCGDGVWEDNTQCKIDDTVLHASQCCMRGYRGLQPTCSSHWHSEHSITKRNRATVMVAIILGAEALLIAVTAVIIVLFNLGRVPNAVTRVFSLCSCNVPSDGVSSHPTSATPTLQAGNKIIYRSTKGQRVIRRVQIPNNGLNRSAGNSKAKSLTSEENTVTI